MATEDFAKFGEKVTNDDALRSKLVALQGTPDAELPEKIAQLARDNGFSVTPEDVDTLLQASSTAPELTDEALAGLPPRYTYSAPGCN